MSITALITGGAGFIGSNMAQRYVDYGYDVTVVDDLSNGHREFVPMGVNHLWFDDFTSPRVLSAIKKQEFSVVHHFAALPRVSYSVEEPLKTHDVNVTRTLKLIDACRGNIKRFVFSSSSSVYGGADVMPTPETEPFKPQSPYALQKAQIEEYLKLYNKLYGFESCCLRYFNVFGRKALGQSPYSTAVSAWLTAIKNGKSMRSDGDGTQSRDMCHVDNVVEANFLAATTDKQLNAEAFNVACGDKVTNNEILQYLLKHYPNATFHSAPVRAGDVKHTLADITKIKTILGYQPVMYFWDGLEDTIKWYDRNWSFVKNFK